MAHPAYIPPAQPPRLGDNILYVMRQTALDAQHGNADPGAAEHLLFNIATIIDELLRHRAAQAGRMGSVENVIILPAGR